MTPRHRPPRHIGPTPRQRTIEQCKAIAARHRTIVTNRPLTLKDIRGPLRWKEIVKARAEVAKFLREERGWSFPQIGQFLDRDHTSIMHLLKPAESRAAKREAYRRWINKNRAAPRPDNPEENHHVEISQ